MKRLLTAENNKNNYNKYKDKYIKIGDDKL